MRQLGYETEECEIVLRQGSDFFPWMQTPPGIHLPDGSGYELRYGIGVTWPATITQELENTIITWNEDATHVNALLTAIATTRNRAVELWYVNPQGQAAAVWSGKVKIDR